MILFISLFSSLVRAALSVLAAVPSAWATERGLGNTVGLSHANLYQSLTVGIRMHHELLQLLRELSYLLMAFSSSYWRQQSSQPLITHLTVFIKRLSSVTHSWWKSYLSFAPLCSVPSRHTGCLSCSLAGSDV